ncbi:hypothetical protein GCM10009541_25740 [Micromonospora gifhornensis]|uniref:Uncharacterized protein n=1 Tax=Micromonospora gifhornensis TaxID=84594 RepID=A0ABQ4IHT1_9ACTN|nr:hypothetical protein Vgi01_41530 [Micromonospora gifhornensis]
MAVGLVLVAVADGDRVGDDTWLGATGRVEETPPTDDEACGAEGVRVPEGGNGRSGAWGQPNRPDGVGGSATGDGGVVGQSAVSRRPSTAVPTPARMSRWERRSVGCGVGSIGTTIGSDGDAWWPERSGGVDSAGLTGVAEMARRVSGMVSESGSGSHGPIRRRGCLLAWS